MQNVNSNSDPLRSDVTIFLEKLKDLNTQQLTLAKHQETTLKWNLQHHKNIVNLIEGFNNMARVVTEISGEKLAFIQPLQDPALLNWKDNEFSNQNTDISTSDDADNDNLHNMIMKHHKNIYSIELQESLLSITESQFHQLKKESVVIILPLVLRWLYSDDAKEFGLLLLHDAVVKFPDLFSNARLKTILDSFQKVIDMTIERVSKSGGNLPVKIIEVRDILEAAQASY